MAMSAEYNSKFATLHRLWWRVHMSEKFSRGTINHKQTNERTNKPTNEVQNNFTRTF